MPFHVIKSKRKDGKFDVANADTGEVKNTDPYDNEKDAQSYSNALNAHSSDTKKGIKGMYDAVAGGLSASDYAVQEAWDIMQACSAMSSVAGLMSSEKEEPDDIRSLAAIMRSLNEFIGGEIDEMERQGTMETISDLGAKTAKLPAEVRTTESPTINMSYVKSLGITTLPKFISRQVHRAQRDQALCLLMGQSRQGGLGN